MDYGWFKANSLNVNGSKTDSTTFTLNSFYNNAK